jgi:predicted transcriptional regulator
MKARTSPLRGASRCRAPGGPKVWFTSTESFVKVLSAGNRELLRIIAEKGCRSIQTGGVTLHARERF